MPVCSPEPDRNKPEIEEGAFQPQLVFEQHSSDEENEEEEEHPELQGYEPLPFVENINESSDEEEPVIPLPEQASETRELVIDSDLVRQTMKNVKLDGTAIPPWAREISECAWKDVIQQAIKGKDGRTDDEKVPTCSNKTQSLQEDPS